MDNLSTIKTLVNDPTKVKNNINFTHTKKANSKDWWNSLSQEQKNEYIEKKQNMEKLNEGKIEKFEKTYGDIISNLTKISSEELEAFFDKGHKFNNFSFKNSLFIFMQDQNASCVAGNKEWFKNGYKLKKGATGLDIFIPVKVKFLEQEINKSDFDKYISGEYNGEKIKSIYKLDYLWSDFSQKDFFEEKGKILLKLYKNSFKISDYKVYDISEIEERFNEKGESLAKRLNNMTESSLISFGVLSDFIENEFGYKVMFDAKNISSGGYVNPNFPNHIFINSNLDELNNTGTLIHEFCHLRLGHIEDDNTLVDSKEYKDIRRREELEAETLTYLLCKDFGIGRNSEMYLKNWKENTDLGDNEYKKIFQKIIKEYEKLRNTINAFKDSIK